MYHLLPLIIKQYINFFTDLYLILKSAYKVDTVRPIIQMINWRRKWQPTPVFLPGKSHGQRRLAGLQSMESQRAGHD